MLTDSLNAYLQSIDDLATYDFNKKTPIRYENYTHAPVAKED